MIRACCLVIILLSVYLVWEDKQQPEIVEIEVLDPNYFDKLLEITQTAIQSSETCVLKYNRVNLEFQKHMLLYHGVIDDE